MHPPNMFPLPEKNGMGMELYRRMFITCGADTPPPLDTAMTESPAAGAAKLVLLNVHAPEIGSTLAVSSRLAAGSFGS